MELINLEMNYDTWHKMIRAKTDKGDIVYFANLTNKQFWWDIYPYYSTFHIEEDRFIFIKQSLNNRAQLMFDTRTKTYSIPINIIEMEHINNGN